MGTERIPPANQPAGFWPLAPDLAVEVISPSETATSVQAKVQDYLAAGTRLIWLVYPDSNIVVEYRSPVQIRQYGIADSLEGAKSFLVLRMPCTACFGRRGMIPM